MVWSSQKQKILRRDGKNTQKDTKGYTEGYKKDLHDPDNHDGVITHLEPDILECEVKWPLESITMNKASGGDGFPVELFQILKDDAVKVLQSICQQIWKTRKAVPGTSAKYNKRQKLYRQKTVRREGKNTQKSYTKKILMTQITMIV